MIPFQIKPDGREPFNVTATARDVLVWEKTHLGRSLTQLREDPSMTLLYELAHVACRRQGLFDGSQELFEETCEIEDEPVLDDEPDPTNAAP